MNEYFFKFASNEHILKYLFNDLHALEALLVRSEKEFAWYKCKRIFEGNLADCMEFHAKCNAEENYGGKINYLAESRI
jgi:hypothetical protein